MVVTRSDAAPLRWRCLAVFITVAAAPMLIDSLGVAGANIARNSAFGLVALIGLLGYAYGFRLGPLLFWRFFSVIFAVGAILRVGTDVVPVLLRLDEAKFDQTRILAAVFLAWVFLLLCLALFRHARLTGTDGKEALAQAQAKLREIFS
jgi:hypothetical protein